MAVSFNYPCSWTLKRVAFATSRKPFVAMVTLQIYHCRHDLKAIPVEGIAKKDNE
jgi:hypothetical protein